MRRFQRLALIGGLLLTPAAAYAQASIAGTVKDSSGAVLPGVTVEASSAVLIEKVRSVTTDGTGVRLINLLEPGTDYSHRVNELDLRISKIFRMGGHYRVSINFDLANVLNANYALGRNGTWGSVGVASPSWLTPLSIMDARLFKFGAQFDF
jgi:hypothetical protein